MRAVLDHAHIVGKNFIRIEAIMSAPNRKALFEGFFAHYGGRYAVFGAAVFDISDDKAGGNPKDHRVFRGRLGLCVDALIEERKFDGRVIRIECVCYRIAQTPRCGKVIHGYDCVLRV